MKFQKSYVLLKKVFVFAVLFVSCLSWAGSSSTALCESTISNLYELATAVTKNAQFSDSKAHRQLFNTYQIQFLGEKNNSDERSLEDIMDIVKRYPELSKPIFREQNLTLEQKTYEPPQSLRNVVQRLKNSANQFQAQIFQPEANIGFWQRLLMPLKKEELNGLSQQEKKTKQQQHKAQFRKYFDQVFTPEDQEVLKDDSMTNIEKTIAVYRILERIRTQMIEEGKEVQALSQAMVDLVHTSGFRNPHYTTLLKSQNALDQVTGLEQILNERDIVAMRLNFSNHFSELINSFEVDHPIGSAKKENLSQVLSDIQKEIQNNPYIISGKQVLRVRALSFQESPFRGCLGGDCSTEEYFDLALDPNFIYFTLTNKEMQSSGHITVVLGTALSKKEKRHIKTAFVDKIQNIPQMMILPMLSAVRLSLEEKGYRLGLPVDVGDHNGLSNMETIRDYINSEVNPLFTHQLEDFKPHKNKYNFYQGHSRAYSNPKLLEFERQEGDFTIEAGETHKQSKIPEELKVENLFQEILSWKDSEKEEDQIQFIDHLKSLPKLEELGLSEDFAENYLKSKIKDRQMPFKLRKKALYTLISLGKRKITNEDILSLMTHHFSENEQKAIVGEISNWIDSNEYYKQDFILPFLYEFLKMYINKNVQFSFQSIIFNMLKDIELKILVLSEIPHPDKADSTDKRIISYLIDDINLEQVRNLDPNYFSLIAPYLAPQLSQAEVQSLEGRILSNFLKHFTRKQKKWVTFKQFREITYPAIRMKTEIAPYLAPYLAPQLSQAEVQSLKVEDLEAILPHLTEEQKDWVTLKQFRELPHYRRYKLVEHFNKAIVQSLQDLFIISKLTNKQKNWITLEQFKTLSPANKQHYPEIQDLIQKLAPKLNQEDVQSLEGEDLEAILPHLTEEQKKWVTFKQFREITYPAIHIKKEIAPYLSPQLSQAEVQSLKVEDLEVILPHLTEEQKDWVTLKQFRELPHYRRYKLVEHFNKAIVQSLQDLFIISKLTDKQKNWITLEQFKTLSSSDKQHYPGIQDLIQKLAPKLNQEEVQSLEGEDLEVLFPHLRDE